MNKCNVKFSSKDESFLSLLEELSNKDDLIEYEDNVENDYERMFNWFFDIITPTSLSNSYSNFDEIIKDAYYLMLDWNTKQKASGKNKNAITTQEFMRKHTLPSFYNYFYQTIMNDDDYEGVHSKIKNNYKTQEVLVNEIKNNANIFPSEDQIIKDINEANNESEKELKDLNFEHSEKNTNINNVYKYSQDKKEELLNKFKLNVSKCSLFDIDPSNGKATVTLTSNDLNNKIQEYKKSLVDVIQECEEYKDKSYDVIRVLIEKEIETKRNKSTNFLDYLYIKDQVKYKAIEAFITKENFDSLIDSEFSGIGVTESVDGNTDKNTYSYKAGSAFNTKYFGADYEMVGAENEIGDLKKKCIELIRLGGENYITTDRYFEVINNLFAITNHSSINIALKWAKSKYRMSDLHSYPSEVFKDVLMNISNISGLKNIKQNDKVIIKQISEFLYGGKSESSKKYNLENAIKEALRNKKGVLFDFNPMDMITNIVDTTTKITYQGYERKSNGSYENVYKFPDTNRKTAGMIRSRIDAVSMSANSDLINKYHFTIENEEGEVFSSNNSNDEIKMYDKKNMLGVSWWKINFNDSTFKYELLNNRFKITNINDNTVICNLENVFDEKDYKEIDFNAIKERSDFNVIKRTISDLLGYDFLGEDKLLFDEYFSTDEIFNDGNEAKFNSEVNEWTTKWMASMMSTVYSSAKNQFLLDLWRNNNYLAEYFDEWYSQAIGTEKAKLLEPNTTFVSVLGNINDDFKIWHNNFIDRMLKSEQSIKGLKSKLTVKNVEENNMSTFRVSGLYSTFPSYWRDTKKTYEINPFWRLLPCKEDWYANMIHDVVLSTDVKTEGFSKMTKKMNNKELFYKSIFLDFWQVLKSNKTSKYSSSDNAQLIIQPTTFSDKTSILNFAINPDFALETDEWSKPINHIINDNEYDRYISEVYIKSIGGFYKTSFNNIYNDYLKLYNNIINEESNTSKIIRNNNINDESTLITLSNILDSIKNVEAIDESLAYRLKCEFSDSLINYIGKPNLYNDLSYESGVTYEDSLHYVKIGNSISMNPVLRYSVGYLYNSKDNFKQRWNHEKVNYLNSLLDENFKAFLSSSFVNSNGNKVESDIDNAISQSALKGQNISELYDKGTGKIILAKYDIVENGERKTINVYNKSDMIMFNNKAMNFRLMPVLDKVFGMSTLLSENFRLAMLGSEMNHQIKREKDGFKGYTNDGNAMLKYDFNAYYEQETARQLAQDKRALICVAPAQYFAQNKIYGCHKYKRMAVMPEPEERVYNYLGEQENIKTIDGGEFMFMAEHILENNTLQDAAVTDVNKPIGYSVNDKYGTTVEVKYASTAITNERIRSSLGNGKIDFYKLLKGNCDVKFDDSVKIDTWMALPPILRKKSFFKNAVSRPLFFTKGGVNYRIDDMVSTNNPNNRFEFERIMYEVDSEGKTIIRNGKSSVVKDTVVLDSLFNIWEALGGMWTMQKKNGELVLKGDDSWYALVDYMNKVGSPILNEKGESLLEQEGIPSQTNVNQPLKDPKYYVSSFNPPSTIKNGEQNRNPNGSWSSDKPLRTMTVMTKGFGIQMNPDHLADDAEITEPSQVMNSLCAGGYTIGKANRAYRALEETMNVVLSNEFDKLDAFIGSKSNTKISIEEKNKIKNEFIEIISRDLLLAKLNRTAGMIGTLVDKLCMKYNISDDRRQQIKTSIDSVPFSDNEVYGSALPNFVSKINKTIIKKKFSGAAMVMCPSDNIHMMYRLDDGNYSSTEIYKKAVGYYNDNPSLARPITNEGMIDGYLDMLQQIEYNKPKDNTWENDLSNVRLGIKIIVPVMVNGEEKYVKVDLDDDIDDYIAIKDNNGRDAVIRKFMEKQGILEPNDTITTVTVGNIFYKDIKSPTNLQPQRIFWKTSNNRIYDIYDVPAIRNAFRFRNNKLSDKELSEFDNSHNIKTIEDNNELKRRRLKAFQNDIDNAMNLLSEGKSPIANQTIIGPVQNVPAENIMSKIYSTSFGIGNNSINEILNDKNFFKRQIGNYNVDLNDHKLWDLKLIINQNKNIKIAFNSTILDSVSNEINGIKSFDANVTTTIKNVNGVEEIWETNKNGYPIIKLGYTETLEDGNVKTKWIMKPVIVVYADGVKERIYSINDDMVSECKYCVADVINNNSISIFNSSNNAKMSELLNSMSSEKGLIKDNSLNSYLKDKNMLLRISELANRKLVSFKKSLDTICLRIPSQSMQSFMNMKTVSFMEGESNNIYVSKWQTYLQGSDYDIDKAYCIGNEFAENGLYVKASPLYDESSYEMSLISDTLPIPNGKKYSLSNASMDEVINVQKYYNAYVTATSNSGRLKALSDVLNLIDEKGYTSNLYIVGDQTKIDEFIGKINEHELYEVSPLLIESAYKNIVSSSIYDVISDLRNATQAYSPITFLNLHDIANKSELGEKSKRSTTMNPATKYQIQSEAQVGKECIGIFATAAKAYFALTYYYDMTMKSGNQNEISKLLFAKKYNITNSVDNNIKMILSNVNVSYLSDKSRLFLTDKLESIFTKMYGDIINNEYTDLAAYLSDTKSHLFGIEGMQHDTALQISAMLSAATDNAKEFILKKINSAANLSGVYSHLLMLGFDLDTIAGFMTSPHIQLINNYSSQDVFDKTSGNNSINTAITHLTSFDISKYFYPVKRTSSSYDIDNLDYESFDIDNSESEFDTHADDTDKTVAFNYIKTNLSKKINETAFKLGMIKENESLIIPTKKGRKNVIEVQPKDVYVALLKVANKDISSAINILNEMQSDNVLISKLSTYMGKKSLIDFVSDFKVSLFDIINVLNNDRYKSKENAVDLFLNDINEFKRIYDDAQEVKTLGSILSMNQGLKTKGSEQIQFIYKLQDFFNERIHKFISGVKTNGNITYNGPDTYENKMDYLLENNMNEDILGKEAIEQTLKKASGFGILDSFDMRKFVIDEDYRNAACDLYGLIKCQYNIFDIINKHPNVRGMYKSFRLILSIQDNIIAKDYMINKMIDNMKNKNNDKVYLNEKEAMKAVGFTDDVIKYNFIINSGFTINPKKKFSKCEEVSNLDENGLAYPVNINDSDSIATFNKFFYDEFIPNLKKGFIGDEYHEELSNNVFIKSIISGYDTSGGSVNMFKKLDIDMNDLSNPQLFAKRARIKHDMFSMKQYQYNGRTLLDWLVLYNFVINKNKYGEERMTTVFQPLINDKTDNLLKDYYNYVIGIDNKMSDMNQYQKDNDNIEDNSIPNPTSDTLTKSTKKGKSTLGLKYGYNDFDVAIAIPTKEVSAKREFIYAWDKYEGSIVLKKRKNNGMYERSYYDMGIGDSIPNTSQINNFKSWYPYKIHNGNMTIEERYDFDKISMFEDMIKKGYLVIQLNCK